MFMAPKKKTNRSATSAFLWRWMLHPITLFALAGFVVLSGVGATIPGMVLDLRAQTDYAYPLENLKINTPNDWVPARLPQQVLQASHLPERVSLLEPQLVREIADAFSLHPWVKQVDRVQITGRRQIVVQVQYRVPIAFIEVGTQLLPIDSEGVLLPSEDFSVADATRLPHIRNIVSAPPSTPGTPWNDALVMESLKVVLAINPRNVVQDHWDRLGLEAVTAPRVTLAEELLPHRLTFELQSRGGSHIVWGHPPGGDDLEPTVAQKIGRLDQYLRQYGSFEKPLGPCQIDIRHFEAISLHPLDQVTR